MLQFSFGAIDWLLLIITIIFHVYSPFSFTSGTHLGLFISFIGFAHLETTITENTILREYKVKEYYLFEGCLCWGVSRRVVRSECTCVKHKSSEKFQKRQLAPSCGAYFLASRGTDNMRTLERRYTSIMQTFHFQKYIHMHTIHATFTHVSAHVNTQHVLGYLLFVENSR